jgi:hypothetical protein
MLDPPDKKDKEKTSSTKQNKTDSKKNRQQLNAII